MLIQKSTLQSICLIALVRLSNALLKAPQNYKLTLLHEVDDTSSLENIAVRHTGELVVTSTRSSSLYQIPVGHTGRPVLIGEFPVLGLLGIAELEQDIFYVVGSNITGLSALPGSNGVWKVDMRKSCTTRNGLLSSPPIISLISMIPDAQLLNGLCRLAPNDNSTLLIADSVAGTITKLDVHTASYKVIARDDTMTNLPDGLQIAINGLHVHQSNLFFTNLNQGLFAQVPISTSNGIITGPVEIIARDIPGDDFALSQDGSRAWVALNGHYTITEVDIIGKTASVAANSSLLIATSSAAFGRSRNDQYRLYITGSAMIGNSTLGGVIMMDIPHR